MLSRHGKTLIRPGEWEKKLINLDEKSFAVHLEVTSNKNINI
jgi:hypothetical protein